MLGRFEYLVFVWRFWDHLVRLLARVQIIRTIASYKEGDRMRRSKSCVGCRCVAACHFMVGSLDSLTVSSTCQNIIMV